MQKVLTAAEMREVDRLTTERYGIPSILLMENAAHAVARVITEKLGGSVKGKSILILCGKGNNGGDGAALARILLQYGGEVTVIYCGEPSDLSGDAATNYHFLKQQVGRVSGKEHEFVGCWFGNETIGSLRLIIVADQCEWLDNKQYEDRFASADIIVDSIFGTGISRQLSDLYESIVKFISTKHVGFEFPPLIAVDIPSGLDADSSIPIGSHTLAEATVVLGAMKRANVLPPASRSNGRLILSDIGLPAELIDEQPSDLFLTERNDVTDWLAKTSFSDESYKNKRGHCLLIAGSESYSGAAVLAGNSAIRSGVGLVTLACPKEAKAEIASRLLPEVILTTIDSGDFAGISSKANAVAVGCGLSATDPEIESLVRKIVEERTTPVIVDAGALWFFNPPSGIPKQDADRSVSAPLIFTPHEGEFMRLLGTHDKDAIKDRVAAVREFSEKNNVILVLKGERVLIGEPGGKVVVNPTGNSGLGKAGNGDTLTGVLAGFCAQAAAMNIDIFETVVAAVYIAGLAGDIAEKKYGKRVMTASDVRECLAETFAQFAE